MSYSGKSGLPLKPIEAGDFALDKLALIEHIQGDRDWCVSVIASDEPGAPRLSDLQRELEGKGSYSSHITENYNGQAVLRVHHVGKEASLLTAFEKLGPAGGIGHAAMQAGKFAGAVNDTAERVVSAPFDLANYALGDPARRLATNYLIGDLIYGVSGENWSDPKDALLNIQGYMGALQSVIHIAFAREVEGTKLSAVENRLLEALSDGEDPLADKIWMRESEDTRDPAKKVMHWMVDNGFDLGAKSQMLGQVLMIASGGLRMHEHHQDAMPMQGQFDVLRGALSLTSWAMLDWINEKHTPTKTRWAENPLERAHQELTERPSVWAGVVTTAASAMGMTSSIQKGLTPKQFMAEAAYLVGDMTFFVTHKADYGVKEFEDAEKTGKAAAAVLSRSPMLLSPSREQALIDRLAGYLADRMVIDRAVEEQKLDLDTPVSEQVKQERDQLAGRLAAVIDMEMVGKDQALDKLTDGLARLAHKFAPEQGEQVTEAMIERIAERPGVSIDKDELRDMVAQQKQYVITEALPEGQRPSMSAVADILADLTYALPAIDPPGNAVSLFDAVTAFVRPSPGQDRIAEAAIMNKAYADLDIGRSQGFEQAVMQRDVRELQESRVR